MKTLTPDHCRLCLNLCPESTTSVASIKTQYVQLTGYVIDENLDIPKKVCDNCVKLMRYVETFQMQCSDTEVFLLEYQNKVTAISEKEEEEEEEIKVEPEDIPLEEEFLDEYYEEVKTVEPLMPVKPQRKSKPRQRPYRKKGYLNFESLKNVLGKYATEAEMFVLSYENPPSVDLVESLEANQDTDLTHRRQTACAYCPFSSFSINEYKDHLVAQHPDSRFFKCPFCPSYQSYSLDRLRLHCMRKTDKHQERRLVLFSSLTCDHCTFECSHQVTMEMHCAKFHPESELACDCGAAFGCRDLKLQHILFECTVASSNCLLPFEEILHFGSPVMEIKEPTNTVICELCGKVLKKHSVGTHKEVCGINGRFQCDLCQCNYKMKIELVRHMKRLHLTPGTYPCNQCERVFINWNSRRAHVRSIHENIKYGCEICGKSFIAKQKRDGHRLTHSDERMFQCDKCDKSFKVRDRLTVHKKLVHAQSQQLACNVCQKMFKNKKLLTQHKQIHAGKEFTCPICQVSFSVGHTLRCHMASLHADFPMPPPGTPLRNVDLNVYLQLKLQEEEEQERL